MVRHDPPQALVQFGAMLVQHHGVGIPVQLLETQSAVILPLNLLDGALQHVPDFAHILFVHIVLLKTGKPV